MLERVFLGGTTAGTTWRQEVIAKLLARGVTEEQIFNPHLPKGTPYTQGRKDEERRVKDDPTTLVLIHICKGRGDIIGAISTFEMGKHAYRDECRTIIVVDSSGFESGSRSQRTLEGLDKELQDDFSGQPPYAATLDEAIDWIVEQLTQPR